MAVCTQSEHKAWHHHLEALLVTRKNRVVDFHDTILVRLRSVSRHMDTLFQNPAAPRKIDVQKLRVEVKNIHRDVSTFAKQFVQDTGIADWSFESRRSNASRARLEKY